MKILLLTDGISPYVLGGMQRHSYFLSRYLVLEGHSVHLYHCVNNDEKLLSNEEVFNVVFDQVPSKVKTSAREKFTSNCIHFPQLDKWPGHYLRESFQYSQLIFEDSKNKLNDFDFIYAKGFSAWKLLSEKEKGLKCPPIGVKFHGMNMFQHTPSIKGRLENYMFRSPAKYNMRMADYVFSYGGKITGIIVNQGINKEKIIDMPTGISKNWVRGNIGEKGSSEKIKFLFVGRYDKVKGIKEIYEAISTLSTDDKEFHFVGPFESENQLKTEHIIYHGKITDEEQLKKIYDSCDILLCPSHSEGMPNAVVEAMARGLGIIATDTGAMSMLVKNGKNGYLIDKSTPKNIKLTINEMLNLSSDQINAMKQKSLQIAQKELSWDNIAKRLTHQLERIVAKRSASNSSV